MPDKPTNEGWEKLQIPPEDMETRTDGRPWTPHQYEYRWRSRNSRKDDERNRMRSLLSEAMWPPAEPDLSDEPEPELAARPEPVRIPVPRALPAAVSHTIPAKAVVLAACAGLLVWCGTAIAAGAGLAWLILRHSS